MAHELSKQQLEEADAAMERIIPLLNQADQELQQVKAILEQFAQSHHLNGDTAGPIVEAIKNLEEVLNGATHGHNEAKGKLAAAKADVHARPEEHEEESEG